MASSSMDTFRNVLDHLDESDSSHQLLFFRVLHAAGAEAVEELADRVKKASASRTFCQLVYESSFYYPWPDWIPVLSRMLRHESDLQMFSVGLRALGRIGNAQAVESLMELSRVRPVPEFQQAVAEVLAEADPEQAFQHHLAGLLEGSSNPRLANEAASHMEDLVNETHLESLLMAIQHPDLLVFRHAIRLVSRIPSPDAAECLTSFLADYHQEVLEDRELKELLPAFRNVSRSDAIEGAVARLAPRLEQRDPQAVQMLQSLSGPDSGQILESLKAKASGSVEAFLLRVLAAAQESNSAPLTRLPAEVTEEIHMRARRLSFAMDNGAEGLAQMVRSGFSPAEKVIPILEKAVRENTGREGLVRAFAMLVPGEASELLDLVILHPEGAMRAVAVEALGERNEESLRPALLKACHDSITDIALQALGYLGRLPGAEALGRQLLHSSTLEEIQLGISFIGMHRLVSLVPELLDLLHKEGREELALKALEALGQVGSPEIAQPLLELLHSGQSPQLQIALASAIRDLKLPEAALALCGKARELKNAEIHVIAAEALSRSPQPLDAEAGQQLMAQMQAAWNEKNPWSLRLRLILALQGVMLSEPEQWPAFSNLVQQALAEKRAPNAWSAEEQGRAMAVAKELARR